MAKERRHIVPAEKEGWDVKKPSASRASSHHSTQAAAEQAAKRSLAKAGGGEAIVHGRDGSIRDSDTVPPARDPMPPRDKRH